MVTVKKKKKKPVSNQAQIDRIKAGGGASRKESLELATSRARGQGIADPEVSRKGIINPEEQEAPAVEKKSKILDQIIDPPTEAGVEKRGILDIIKDIATGETIKRQAGELGEGLKAGTIPLGVSPATIKSAPAIFDKATNVIKSGQVGKGAVKIADAFKQNAGSAGALARFANNLKSQILTGAFLKKKNLAGLVGVIGTYPFAGFIKEEALQTLSFGFKTANDNDDLEGMGEAIQNQEELLNPEGWTSLIASIPFANIIVQLKSFFKAAQTKLDIDKRIFASKQSLKGGEE